MEDLEVHCLNLLDFNVITFLRYIDDTFAILPNDRVQDVVDAFNSYHPRLKFTYELENDNSINFLDTTVIRDDNRLITNWYRKPTFSGLYVNYFSGHSVKHKSNVVKGLVDRALLLSDSRYHESNIEIVRSILSNNCYPVKFANRILKERIREIEYRDVVTTNEKIKNSELNRFIKLPYVKNISETLVDSFKRYGFRVVFTMPKKLDCIIGRRKDKLDDEKKNCVVYKFDCANCESCYIGQTKRHLKTRIDEHMSNIRKNSDNHSVVSRHRLNDNHEFKWRDVSILHQESNVKNREIAEMFHIKRHNNAINSMRDTENLPSIYDNILTNT
ncbi:hypothetical protein X777_00505 [Ooceraea biroi]|nr:hypothetical protein X777_00505 [Ooceraea biroi]